jgi:tRNA-Thr(GGU) m(6)t(6)A37 methyltransferase TsaA
LVKRVFKIMPIGMVENEEEVAKIRVFVAFCDGLYRLSEFSHLIVLYWFHERDTENERRVLRVIPKRHQAREEVGVFASRSPSRPNPISMCMVKLVKIEGCSLTVEGLDAFKDSPIIDIKPYLPNADFVPDAMVPKWTSHGKQT